MKLTSSMHGHLPPVKKLPTRQKLSTVATLKNATGSGMAMSRFGANAGCRTAIEFLAKTVE